LKIRFVKNVTELLHIIQTLAVKLQPDKTEILNESTTPLLMIQKSDFMKLSCLLCKIESDQHGISCRIFRSLAV